jgi:hypothetical protein
MAREYALVVADAATGSARPNPDIQDTEMVALQRSLESIRGRLWMVSNARAN